MLEQTNEQDALRPCPVCRTPISVLAVRCRHCGAEVGRPRKEAEKLTIKDLGGVTETTYTVSGNVMEALESFRAEELSSQETQRRQKEAARQSWFGQPHGHGHGENPQHHAAQGLPELDESHRDLADSIMEPSSTSTPKRKANVAAAGAGITRKVFLFCAITAGLVLIYLGTDIAWGKIKTYLDSRHAGEKIVYENKARDILARGDIAAALAEANEALKYNNTPENQDIAIEVRARLIGRVSELLTKEAYDPQDHRQASDLVSRAVTCDNDPAVRDLRDKVNGEMAAYNMVCKSIDAPGGKATFTVYDKASNSTEMTVGVGSVIADRFVVGEITAAAVRLTDKLVTTRNGLARSVVARRGYPLAPG